jgi:hypothetical protein
MDFSCNSGRIAECSTSEVCKINDISIIVVFQVGTRSRSPDGKDREPPSGDQND